MSWCAMRKWKGMMAIATATRVSLRQSTSERDLMRLYVVSRLSPSTTRQREQNREKKEPKKKLTDWELKKKRNKKETKRRRKIVWCLTQRWQRERNDEVECFWAAWTQWNEFFFLVRKIKANSRHNIWWKKTISNSARRHTQNKTRKKLTTTTSTIFFL